MRDVATIPALPPAELRRRRRGSVIDSVLQILQHRELVTALVRRDFSARYKQTFLGAIWALLLPAITVVIFALFLRRFAHANTHGAPYALWSYVGLLAWTLFSNAASNGGLALISNQPLLNKVYSPRQIYPIAGVLLACVDALISAVSLVIVFVATGFAPRGSSYWLPLIILVQLVFVLAVTLLISIIVVYVRDLRSLIPVVLQLGLFATPVVFGLDQVSGKYRLLYCFLNPMAPVIDSYRRTVLYGMSPDTAELAAGAATSVVLLFVAFSVFKRLEQGIVDII